MVKENSAEHSAQLLIQFQERAHTGVPVRVLPGRVQEIPSATFSFLRSMKGVSRAGGRAGFCT